MMWPDPVTARYAQVGSECLCWSGQTPAVRIWLGPFEIAGLLFQWDLFVCAAGRARACVWVVGQENVCALHRNIYILLDIRASIQPSVHAVVI